MPTYEDDKDVSLDGEASFTFPQDHPDFRREEAQRHTDELNKTREVRDRITRIVQDCAKSRRYFVEAVLGAELEDWQGEVCDAMDNGQTRISIRSGNGVGKTFLCSVLALHFLLFRPECKIVVTSPSSSQLRDGLYPEVCKWINVLPEFLRCTLNVVSDRISRHDNSANAFISFRTARKETPEALAGIHSEHVLCIVDEASGVAEEVYRAAQGTLSTTGAIFLLIGNPWRLNGYFYNTFHKLSSYWMTKQISSFDSRFVDQAFVDTIIRTYGKDSAHYNVMVLGEFPKAESNALISREIVQSAVFRDIEYSKTDQKVWGLDPARGGDETAWVERIGRVITDADEWSTRDAMQTLGRIKERWDSLPEHDRPEYIFVDSIGIGGPIADRGREMGLPFIDINVSESASMKTIYPKMRDELWYKSKFFFEGLNCTIKIPDENLVDRLVEELSAPLVRYTSTGLNGVEPKDGTRSRLLRSTNLADAFNLTLALDVATAGGHVKSSKSSWATEIEMDLSHIH